MSAETRTTLRNSEETSTLASAFIAGLNSHDLSAWYALLADAFTADYPGGSALGKEEARRFNQAFLDAFPDLHFEVHRTLVDGSCIAVQWTASGAHTAPLDTGDGGMIAPTGRSASIAGVLMTEVANGKIAREWTYWDRVSLLTQLGLMPSA